MRPRYRQIPVYVAVAVGVVLWGLLAFWLLGPNANTLIGAAARGEVDRVRLCLFLGVDPNSKLKWGWHRTNDGQTPLTAAAQYGRVDVVRLLLAHGADPNLLDSSEDFPHDTPLSTAARNDELEVCRVLLEAGADPNIPTNTKQPGDPGNWTALDFALHGNHSNVAALLRKYGAAESGRRNSELQRHDD